MADETSRRYLFVAIDRATRWVLVRIYNSKTAANARRFLRDLERACPLRIRTILTDNGKEFTDRLFGLRKRAQSGKHEFDKLCTALDIEHRLTPPKSPQTNGMVERFNGRIEDVLQSHHFQSGEELEATLHRYVWLYNQQLPQSALGSKTPLQAMKDWHKLKPEMFKKQPYYRPGCDSYDTILSSARLDPFVMANDCRYSFLPHHHWACQNERDEFDLPIGVGFLKQVTYVECNGRLSDVQLQRNVCWAASVDKMARYKRFSRCQVEQIHQQFS